MRIITGHYECAGFVDQPKNVTVLQGRNATLAFSTESCGSVLGTKKFINGTIDVVKPSELDVIDGDQQGKKKLYKVTLSHVTEPVEVQFEAFKTPSSPSENIKSQTAFVLVQGCIVLI